MEKTPFKFFDNNRRDQARYDRKGRSEHGHDEWVFDEWSCVLVDMDLNRFGVLNGDWLHHRDWLPSYCNR
jgi:hypothetical protein